MTRLQKMLSQIKTIEELADLLKTEPNHIFAYTGISKDGERLIKCGEGDGHSCEGCKECAAYINKRCTSKYDNFRAYVNAEIPETLYTDTDGLKITTEHTAIVKLRDSARKLIETVTFEGFNQGHTAQTVYHHVDEYVDLLEGIGLFEENELRAYVATDLLKVLIERRTGTK